LALALIFFWRSAPIETHIFWSPWDTPGLEHLRLTQSGQGILADGMLLAIKDDQPFRARYTIRCDPDWRVREVELSLLDSSQAALHLFADAAGRWLDASGSPVSILDGCLDVDISITPFTNTLPIHRLNLEPGQSAQLAVAYFAVPEMEVKRAKQRYTCLSGLSSTGGLYRYEDLGLFPGFSAQLPVDAQGLVLDYPELFRRVWAG
jgi:uncharacterized protein